MANDFEEILRTVPVKRSRSPLEPYRYLVEELRRRGLALREIAIVLAQQCNVQTSHVAIHKLLHHKYAREDDAKCEQTTSRVTMAKSIKNEAMGTSAREFHFDPNEPLKLTPKTTRK